MPVVELRAVVEPVSYMGPYIAAVDPELEQQMIERIRGELSERAAEAPEGVSVSTRVTVGSAAESLLDAAADGAGMVVAGSRSYGTLHRAIAGSVSGALLTQSRVPVLITPRNAESARQAA
jgi:nucleotide-binding universal stress UspA family protein